MNRIHGKVLGPMFFREDTSFHGMIDGNATVAPGVTLLMHGMIAGNLYIEQGARVELRAMVAGSAVNKGELIIYGVVRGLVRDEDGGQTTLTNIGPFTREPARG